MKQLAALGKFITLCGIVERNVPCCVVRQALKTQHLASNVGSRALTTLYFQGILIKSDVHDLTNVFDYLKKSYLCDHVIATEIVVEEL